MSEYQATGKEKSRRDDKLIGDGGLKQGKAGIKVDKRRKEIGACGGGRRGLGRSFSITTLRH